MDRKWLGKGSPSDEPTSSKDSVETGSNPEIVLAEFVEREKKLKEEAKILAARERRKVARQEEEGGGKDVVSGSSMPFIERPESGMPSPQMRAQMERKKEMDSAMERLMSDIDIKTNTCREIVMKLFFSDTRSEIYVFMELKKMISIKKELKSYYATRSKCGISICFMDAFKYYYKSYMRQTFIVEESGERVVERTFALPKNEEFLDFSVAVVVLQWKISCLSPYGLSNPADLDFINHTLAVLCHLKKGGRKQQISENTYVQIIPPSEFARKHWPPLNDIEHYGFKKSMITMGTRTLMKVWKSIYDDTTCEFPSKTLEKVYAKIKHV